MGLRTVVARRLDRGHSHSLLNRVRLAAKATGPAGARRRRAARHIEGEEAHPAAVYRKGARAGQHQGMATLLERHSALGRRRSAVRRRRGAPGHLPVERRSVALGRRQSEFQSVPLLQHHLVITV